MDIYSVLRGPIRGQLGEGSRLAERRSCPVCGQRYRQEVDFLELELDYYEDEPLVFVADRFGITSRLREALESHGFSGLEFRPMGVTQSAEYAAEEPHVSLPEFFEMLPEESGTAGPGWWEPADRCDACGRRIWESTPFTIRAVVGAHEDDSLPRRTVVQESYDGADMFYTDDPGPVIMTARLVDFLKREGVTDLALQPADWI